MLKNSLRQLLEISLMISPLIIFIFLLRKNILRRLGPTARLLLWLPLIIQLIIPVSWQTRRSPYQLVADEVQLNLLTHESSYQEIPLEEMTEETRTAAEFYDPTPVVKADLIMDSAVKIWLGGIAVLILVNFISQLRLRRRLQARGCADEKKVQIRELLAHAGCRNVAVLESPEITSCAVYGHLFPRLIISERWADWPAEDQELMIRHECLHLRYGHPWLCGILRLVEILYWFNPLVWLMMREIRRDLELQIDDRLLKNQPQPVRCHYAAMILNAAAGPRHKALQGLSGSEEKQQLKERLSQILRKNRISGLIAGLIVICLCGLCGAMLLKPKSLATREGTVALDVIGLQAYEYSVYAQSPEVHYQCQGKPSALEQLDEKTIHAGIDTATLIQDGKAVSLQTLAFGRAEAEIQWTLPETNGLACSGKETRLSLLVSGLPHDQPSPQLPEKAAQKGVQPPLENPIVLCRWGCYAGHQATDATDPDNDQAAVLAVADGVVTEVSYSSMNGKFLVIDHGDEVLSYYIHLGDIQVEEGQNVKRGEKVGIIGSTGKSPYIHVHFFLMVDGLRVNSDILFRR